MTAHAMKGDRERCLEAGMDAYVSKPLQAQQLFADIDSVFAPRAESVLGRETPKRAARQTKQCQSNRYLTANMTLDQVEDDKGTFAGTYRTVLRRDPGSCCLRFKSPSRVVMPERWNVRRTR